MTQSKPDATDPLAGAMVFHTILAKDEKSLRKLLLAGFPVEGDRTDTTPLIKASGGGRSDVVGTLVEFGANVDAKDSEGDTPLHKAARKGRTGAVLILLEAGAKPGVLNAKGKTPKDVAKDLGVLSLFEKDSLETSVKGPARKAKTILVRGL